MKGVRAFSIGCGQLTDVHRWSLADLTPAPETVG
jgi:hypothetical protein